MKIKFKFKNGQTVLDIVTGMTGIITGSVIWLNGCIQYSVQPPLKESDSTKPDPWWIDEEQLEFIDEGINRQIKTRDAGGPSLRSPH